MNKGMKRPGRVWHRSCKTMGAGPDRGTDIPHEHGDEKMTNRRGEEAGNGKGSEERALRGIVVNAGGTRENPHPRISAFIWGGKTRPTPTLPYGRWKGAA